ncbi:PepSY domain-containing protein [Sulfitobacter mediterraneus]|uniref:PepSY-associated TM helix domain-containing protein n=1 Tax=Sulfitobacter mediterraneus TaxID=83219 RepID=UPI0019335D37|nr:PepSY domain-containing protein [Sulfitobacter mediterraneus]MBM1311282.1 PepSY domain-containing protein [Sulfitobacter mediterraneus]MBM1315164.1 PepSY domain-containing protein [Sulfitobacter mediterraneus]MBM1323525.1 PepSY domain-containing protein [Sulfitobacter mediterraneus]MBM1327437.1 PepSY domain-containing protein [Sulfitobacter mediterraneus]MBM1398785.1 PepSY domain-containing protein [Sulfitobacter mediterraneus]
MTTLTTDAPQDASANKFYFAAWRWHFYAGLFVIPFLAVLAVTGMAMLWIAWIDGRDGERTAVTPQEIIAPLSEQAAAAVTAIPEGTLKQYVAPRTADVAALFRVDHDGEATMVAVDPYTAKVIETFPRRSGWYDFVDGIHSDLMLGVTGDRMLETAASLALVLVATGVYMWWPRAAGWRKALVPSLSRGRNLWKSLHGVIGIWLSLFLVFFLISGLAWAGIWGGKFVQAWSQFPAEKWDAVPLSDDTHANMNHARREVPWALELTPMPASGSTAGIDGITAPAVTLNSVDAFAREIGFDARYQMNLPKGDTGVWTLSRDSMSTDSTDPMSDRTVHIDQYTGKILADVRYDDYSLTGKAMAVGIALHMGTLGLWSVLANTVVCISVLFLCVSSLVLWWKRRPAGASRLSAPPLPKEMPLWQGAALVGIGVSMAFPMAGIALLSVLAIDSLILSRLPGLRRALT